MDSDILNIFKSAFNIEVENKVELRDNNLIVYLKDSTVVIAINEMFKL